MPILLRKDPLQDMKVGIVYALETSRCPLLWVSMRLCITFPMSSSRLARHSLQISCKSSHSIGLIGKGSFLCYSFPSLGVTHASYFFEHLHLHIPKMRQQKDCIALGTVVAIRFLKGWLLTMVVLKFHTHSLLALI